MQGTRWNFGARSFVDGLLAIREDSRRDGLSKRSPLEGLPHEPSRPPAPEEGQGELLCI